MGERGCQLSFLKLIKKSYVAQSCPTLCDSLRPHGLQPTRLLPWDLPGKGPRVGCKAYAAKSGLSFPPPGDLPNTGNKATSLASPVLAGGFLTTESPGKHLLDYITESSRMRYGVGHYYIQVPVSCREFASFHLCSSLGQLHFHLKSFLLAARWQQQYCIVSALHPQRQVSLTLAVGIENPQEQFSLAWLGSRIYSIFVFHPFTVAEEKAWLSLAGLGT